MREEMYSVPGSAKKGIPGNDACATGGSILSEAEQSESVKRNQAGRSRDQNEYLCAFLDHGEVDISNNLEENAIHLFVAGRKNWLFCDSVKGADSSAIMHTLVETAKVNGINPYCYLLRMLSWVTVYGKTPATADVETLMSWHPRMKDLKDA